MTKLMNIKSSPHGAGRHLYNSIRYILNPEKTKNGILTGGNSGCDAGEVYQTMLATKQDWGKPDGRQGYHFVLSWKPGETDVDTAYQMVKEFCEEYLGDEYDYVFAIHDDQQHVHGHIVFNSVNRNTGYKYRYENGDWEKKIQPVTDKICERHGLGRLEYDHEEKKGKSYAEYRTEKEGKWNWKKVIRSDIDYVISCSESYEDFIKQIRMLGYKINEGYSWKKCRDYVSFCAPGQERAWRDDKLGEGYRLEEIKRRIRKENFRYDIPRPPRIKKCRMQPVLKNHSYLSSYQIRSVRILHRTSTYYRNPYAVDQAKVRKNMLQIDRLREDCSYLIRRNIRSGAELEKREEELLKAEKILKEQQGGRYPVREEEQYREYLEVKRKLAEIPESDDSFEMLQDQMEELEERLPKNIDAVESDFQEAKQELAAVRQEKRIIRHIKKMEKEMDAIPVPPRENRKKDQQQKARPQKPNKVRKDEIWQKK